MAVDTLDPAAKAARKAEKLKRLSGDASDAAVPGGIPEDIQKGFDATAAFFERAVFIAGMGRSGTTLLLRLIDGHPDVFLVPHESMVFTHFLASFRNKGDVKAVVEGVTQRFGKMMTDKAHLAEGKEFLRHALPVRLRGKEKLGRAVFRDLLACLTLEHSPADKRMWLEKTPKNEVHLAEIFENFPKAKVIFNVRDPRAVYASNVKGNVRNTTPAGVAHSWAQRLNLMLDFLAANPGRRERVFFTRYEDYVGRPNYEIPRMLNFLGIDPNVEVKPTFHGESWSGNSYDAKANTPGKIDDKKINAWRSEISAEDAAIIAREASFEMSLVGYKD